MTRPKTIPTDLRPTMHPSGVVRPLQPGGRTELTTPEGAAQ